LWHHHPAPHCAPDQRTPEPDAIDQRLEVLVSANGNDPIESLSDAAEPAM
jgi:hypothetical protein